MKTQISSNVLADSGLIIGFSGTYYCLWSWRNETFYSMTGSGSYAATGGTTKYGYIKRISTDLNKVKELYPNLTIDMDLHGQKWERSGSEAKREVLPNDVFPYGFRGVGDKIMESNEVKFLWSLYLSSNFGIGRSKVYARRRLVELGLLVPYKTSNNIEVMRYDNESYQEVPTGEVIVVRQSYCSPKYAAKLEAAKSMVRGHFYNDGDKVVLKVKKIGSFSFDTKFGKCFVIEYKDAENRVFKYKGSTPPYFEQHDDFTTIKATIKHGEYKGQNESLIQRISIIN